MLNSDYGGGNSFGYGNDFHQGWGFGDGFSATDGFDDGSGYGVGSSSGAGSCCNFHGYGVSTLEFDWGAGFGDSKGLEKGIEKINGDTVYYIDEVATIIKSVHGNIAYGYILKSDLTLLQTYVAKCGRYFSHGETARDAMTDARRKYENHLPVSERLRRFNEAFPDRDKPIPARELFEWHGKLTDSCVQGRISFCQNHGLDWMNGEYTVNRFIELTKNAYGGEVIKRLNNV